jgi:hypothetical protein
LRSNVGQVSQPPAGEPITQLILGVFSRDTPESRARDVLDRLRKLVVDYNELRVMSPREMAEHLGDYPDVWTKCEDVSRALNKCFATQHAITLDHLRERPKKDIREFLDGLDGLDPYSRARIRLLGLQNHAMPLDEAMWAYARKTRIVDAKCSLETAQTFLERHIAEKDALEVYVLLKKQAWSDMGGAVRRRDVERICSVPPDRASRNMLQPIVRPLDGDGKEDVEPDEPLAPEPKEKRSPTRRPRSSARADRTAKKTGRRSPSRAKKKTAAAKRRPPARGRNAAKIVRKSSARNAKTARKRKAKSA